MWHWLGVHRSAIQIRWWSRCPRHGRGIFQPLSWEDEAGRLCPKTSVPQQPPAAFCSSQPRGKRSEGKGLRSRIFFWHVTYLFACFLFERQETRCPHWLWGGLVKVPGKSFINFFFSQHILQSLSECVYGAEVNGTTCTEKGRANIHNLATLSSPAGRREASWWVAGLRFLARGLQGWPG